MLFGPGIHELVESGDVAAVEARLGKKPEEANKESRSKGSPLDIAARRGDAPMVRALLSHGASAGASCASAAVASRSPEVVELVFAARPQKGGAAPAERRDALLEAFSAYDSDTEREKHEAYCRAVVDAFVKAKLPRDGEFCERALGAAISSSTPGVLEYLEKAGFKPRGGAAPLFDAIGDRDEALVAYLVGRDPAILSKKSGDGEFALAHAVFCWNLGYGDPSSRAASERILSLLLGKGADAKAKDRSGRSAYFDFVWYLFMQQGPAISSPLLAGFEKAAGDEPMARGLRMQLAKGHGSRAPLRCKRCEKVSYLEDLVTYRELLKSNSSKVTCPHCGVVTAGSVFNYEFAPDSEWLRMEAEKGA